jgi:hypothetical protein
MGVNFELNFFFRYLNNLDMFPIHPVTAANNRVKKGKSAIAFTF